ncbi:MAG: 2-C-methyl-D-erythritol 4-phosphate cytidylyltransferase [Muribaculaceae bacterium]|nr:2-C-methyl-D-erythritol 4-phosphate cytidylyltransferase [Muribaculaceae bacterium]
MKVFLLLMAGGIGSRVGADVPKQFIEIFGKPIIAYTLEIFEKHKEIDFIEIVCVKGFEKELEEIAEKAGISKLIKIVEGGADYEHSIINGVKGLEGIAQPDDIVMIHWAASPFVTGDIISDNIQVCEKFGNAISSCKPFVLYGTRNGNHADDVIDRDTFMCMTAPQSFKFGNIKKLYSDCEREGLFDKIEPHTTNFMAALNMPIYFSKGNQTNIKITTQEDLLLFKGYVMVNQLSDK